jgi:hypothetical protein
VVDLSKNDVVAAETEATADLPSTELRTMAKKLQAKGGFVDMTSNQINVSDFNGIVTCQLHGVATFSSGS